PLYYCYLTLRRPQKLTLFPYTTLFRSTVKNFFCGASAHQHREFLEHERFAVQILVFVGQERGDTKRPAARNDADFVKRRQQRFLDRKSTRLNSSHQIISYAVFCLIEKR